MAQRLSLDVEVEIMGRRSVADRSVASAGAPVVPDSAFSIFFRFQVTDFDRLLSFFSLCHFIFS